MERKDFIEILDSGIEGPTIGPEFYCCAHTFGVLNK